MSDVAGRTGNFIVKAACLVMGRQRMLGGEMEKGLAQMKALVEGRGSYARSR